MPDGIADAAREQFPCWSRQPGRDAGPLSIIPNVVWPSLSCTRASTNLVASLAVGLAIGLGFQGSLSNLAAGVLLLVFRPFKIGDSVVVGGQTGVVGGIDLFTANRGQL